MPEPGTSFPAAIEAGANFLHPAAPAAANARAERGTGVDRARTLCNKLSSQALCFTCSARSPARPAGSTSPGDQCVCCRRLNALPSARQGVGASSHATLSGMSLPAGRRATYQDVLDAPAGMVAELIDGVLHTQPRPATLHAQAATVLGEELGRPFKRGRGGPGGWILLDEPEVHLGEDVLVPDLGGWRRETLPELPDASYLAVAPDWVAEVLSPSTRRHDRARKLPVYAAHCVHHVWLIDPSAQTLEVLRLDGDTYRLLATHAGDAPVRAGPFEARPLHVGALWQR